MNKHKLNSSDKLYLDYWNHPIKPKCTDSSLRRAIKSFVWYFCPIFYKYNLNVWYRDKEYCQKHNMKYINKFNIILLALYYPIKKGFKNLVRKYSVRAKCFNRLKNGIGKHVDVTWYTHFIEDKDGNVVIVELPYTDWEINNIKIVDETVPGNK